MSNRTPSVGTLVEAVAFAASKHRDQRRKDVAASPYINHPIALANVLANEGGCWRRFKIEPPCRLNFEPGLMANL